VEPYLHAPLLSTCKRKFTLTVVVSDEILVRCNANTHSGSKEDFRNLSSSNSFLTGTVYILLVFPVSATCRAHPAPLNLITRSSYILYPSLMDHGLTPH